MVNEDERVRLILKTLQNAYLGPDYSKGQCFDKKSFSKNVIDRCVCVSNSFLGITVFAADILASPRVHFLCACDNCTPNSSTCIIYNTTGESSSDCFSKAVDLLFKILWPTSNKSFARRTE